MTLTEGSSHKVKKEREKEIEVTIKDKRHNAKEKTKSERNINQGGELQKSKGTQNQQ